MCVPMYIKRKGGDNSGGETDKWQCEGKMLMKMQSKGQREA